MPSAGRVGDRVTITGNNFSTKQSEIEVRFHNTPAKILELSASKIVVEIPSGISNYDSYNNAVLLQILMGGQTFTVQSNFRLLASPQDFSPKSGTFGTTVAISGENFPTSYYNNLIVKFGEVIAQVSSTSNTGIVVIVPGQITQERSKITVSTDGQITELPGEFEILAPAISSLSSRSGYPGSTITIYGTNFNPGYYYNRPNIVKFGEIEAGVVSSSATSVTVNVPSQLSMGEYAVSLFNGVHTVTSTENFAVLAPALTGFSPTSGTVGTEITLTGHFDPSLSYSILFGTLSTYAHGVTATTIKTYVPYGITPGKMKISVTAGAQTLTSSEDFTALAPVITGFSPESGVPGTQVTITGTGFSPNVRFNAVKFGTVETAVVSATATSVTAVVPSHVNPGAMKLTVISNGQTAVSEQNFTVTK